MPMARAVRITRQAISPRLAMRILLNIFRARLQRDVVVLLPGILELLVAQHGEGAAEAAAGAVRHDDVVDEATRARDEGVGELGAVLLGALRDLRGIADVGAEDDLDRALRPH